MLESSTSEGGVFFLLPEVLVELRIFVDLTTLLPEVLIQASKSYHSKHLLKKKMLPLNLWCYLAIT
jgi:hypothetical protein